MCRYCLPSTVYVKVYTRILVWDECNERKRGENMQKQLTKSFKSLQLQRTIVIILRAYVLTCLRDFVRLHE